MLIVIEGCDGTGKTTFTEDLHNVFYTSHGPAVEVQMLHWSQPKEDAITEYLGPLEGYDPADHHKLVICDRHWMGEMIYGPLYRGESIVTEPIALAINEWLRRRGAYQLVLDLPQPIVEHRLAERGEDFLQSDHISHVLRRYRELAGRYHVQMLHEPFKNEHVVGALLMASVQGKTAAERMSL